MEIKGDLAYLSTVEELAIQRSSPMLVDMLDPFKLMRELDERKARLKARQIQVNGHDNIALTEPGDFMRDALRLEEDAKIVGGLIGQLLERQYAL